jgi:hypothetical protein
MAIMMIVASRVTKTSITATSITIKGVPTLAMARTVMGLSHLHCLSLPHPADTL